MFIGIMLVLHLIMLNFALDMHDKVLVCIATFGIVVSVVALLLQPSKRQLIVSS